MGEPVRHRQTKEAGTDMFAPKATASHPDSTATTPFLRSSNPDLRRRAIGCDQMLIGSNRVLVPKPRRFIRMERGRCEFTDLTG